jgi:hypothetical protein
MIKHQFLPTAATTSASTESTTARRVDWDRESHGDEGCGGQAPVEPAGGEQIAARRRRGPPRQASVGGVGRGFRFASKRDDERAETGRDVYFFCSTKSGFASDYGRRATGVLHLHASNGVCICLVGSRARLSVETNRCPTWKERVAVVAGWSCGCGGGVSRRSGPGPTGAAAGRHGPGSGSSINLFSSFEETTKEDVCTSLLTVVISA